jgi:hypothetical protein
MTGLELLRLCNRVSVVLTIKPLVGKTLKEIDDD